MAVRSHIRPEVLAKERAIAAQRYRRENVCLAVAAGVVVAIMLLLTASRAGAEAAAGVLLVYFLSIPLVGLLLWLAALVWWGVNCTLFHHFLRVAALNAVGLCAMLICAMVRMPFFGTAAIVVGLMVLILRGLFDLDKPESIVAALVIFFLPALLSTLATAF